MKFAGWLQKQLGRDDTVGCLADWVENTRPKETDTSTFESQLRRYQRGYGLTNAQYCDMRWAYTEYKAACHDIGRMYEIWEEGEHLEVWCAALSKRTTNLQLQISKINARLAELERHQSREGQ